jgi:ribonuclease-3
MIDERTSSWLAETLRHRPRDLALYERALTHASHGDQGDYERLEFLGDRVLGLAMAAWLYELFPGEPEGKLSRRLNALVARETCAEVGRELEIGTHVRLGKQALGDGAAEAPEYRLANRSGPQHSPTFLVEVEIRGVGSASAQGASKQEAETAAAAKLLEELG